MRFPITWLLFFVWLLLGHRTLHAQSAPTVADSLALSELNIPIRINLKPFYNLAEKSVDTVFTSPNYPDDWVQEGCATRYKYYFRRSPLRIQAGGTRFDLSFTGFYKIIGSTRACAGSTVLSPWTPDCSCGFREGERKVEIGFRTVFRLLPDYRLVTQIVRTEPKPLSKCSVCFWRQDITATVMNGLKRELDAAKKALEDSFAVVNLKPYFQQAWQLLQQTYTLPRMGYVQLHPKHLRMDKLEVKNDELQVNIGLTARPVVSFLKPDQTVTTVPPLSQPGNQEGFNIHIEAALQYDSLSRIMNGYLAGKRFELSEGLIKKHIVVETASVKADTTGNLLIRLDFSGSFTGTVFLTGKPYYNAAEKAIEVANLDYDVQTHSFLLNTARWLFNKRILNELHKYASFSMVSYYDTAAQTLNTWLNKEWAKGVRGQGSVGAIHLTAVKALPEHLLVRSQCRGNLVVQITEVEL